MQKIIAIECTCTHAQFFTCAYMPRAGNSLLSIVLFSQSFPTPTFIDVPLHGGNEYKSGNVFM